MDPDDEVCLCFHVSLRKIRTFLERENPPVASLISECLSAGTGCMWCVPFLKHLHNMHQQSKEPDLNISPEEYARTRLKYHDTDERDPEVVQRATREVLPAAGGLTSVAKIEVSPADPGAAPGLVEPILRSVPEWFGIESATRMYIEKSGEFPTYVARVGDEPAGFVTLARTAPKAADIFCIAVHKQFHGKGVGTALVRYAEDMLRREEVEYLHVKTMGPSKPNREYARTLRFYEKMGFTALEELHGLWPGIPCLVLVKKL